MAALACAWLALAAASAPSGEVAPSTVVWEAVAVFRLQTSDPAAASVLSDDVVAVIRHSARFPRVVSPTEVDAMVGALGQEQMRDCALDRCAVLDGDLGGALGVSHVVVGTVAALPGGTGISLRLVELVTAREVALVRKDVPAGQPVAPVLRQATVELLGAPPASPRSVTAGGTRGGPSHVAAPRSERSSRAARTSRRLPLVMAGSSGVVLGAGAFVATALVVGLVESAVLVTYFIYPLPTPTRNYGERVALLNGAAAGGVLLGAGVGLVSMGLIGASALLAGVGAALVR